MSTPKYEFNIPQTEQTPRVDDYPIAISYSEYIDTHKDAMNEFMTYAKTRSNCAGLAANQVELNGQRFMHRMFAFKRFQKGMPEHLDWDMALDPKIVKRYGNPIVCEEGCLTWRHPEYVIVADRYLKIEVEYYDVRLQKQKRATVYGFLAQVFQHEINHLNGVEEKTYKPMDLKIGQYRKEIPKPTKLERNAPCPCGSGKKHKLCCYPKIQGVGTIEFVEQ